MISRAEIQDIVNQTGLTTHVVEKDYVLGWLLAGIYAQPDLSKAWVFKGGTCLKKCYFETYRFSEDLDFTVTDEAQLDDRFLLRAFAAISEWIYQQSGIEIPAEKLDFDVYQNPRGSVSCQGRVYYRSHFQREKSMPRVKLDLTTDETIVLSPVEQPVMHNYEDLPERGITARCYDYAELFAEKIRALAERGSPRDLYDVINIYNRSDIRPTAPVVLEVVGQKCRGRGIPMPTMDSVAASRDTLVSSWQHMLAHQLPQLPPFEHYWDELPPFFAWLRSEIAIPTLASIPASQGHQQIYRPAYGRLGIQAAARAPIEIIRFSAGNHLCVDIYYEDERGHRAIRTIEPYSLRRTEAGDVLLYAVRADDGQIRAYRVDRILSATGTSRRFAPRYAIELSPSAADAFGKLATTGTHAPRLKRKSRSRQSDSPK